MIDFTNAKDGTRIFTWCGRFLCSRYRPIDEARDWVEKHTRYVSSQKSIVVLGLANGFHVVELAKKYPGKKIYVINDRSEFLTPVMNLHDLQYSLFNVISSEKIEELKASSQFQKIFSHSFAILKYSAATQESPCFFNEAEELLVGRTQASLQFHLKMRALQESIPMTHHLKERQTDKGLQLLSFKDIGREWQNKSTETELLLGILEELVN